MMGKKRQQLKSLSYLASTNKNHVETESTKRLKALMDPGGKAKGKQTKTSLKKTEKNDQRRHYDSKKPTRATPRRVTLDPPTKSSRSVFGGGLLADVPTYTKKRLLPGSKEAITGQTKKPKLSNSGSSSEMNRKLPKLPNTKKEESALRSKFGHRLLTNRLQLPDQSRSLSETRVKEKLDATKQNDGMGLERPSASHSPNTRHAPAIKAVPPTATADNSGSLSFVSRQMKRRTRTRDSTLANLMQTEDNWKALLASKGNGNAQDANNRTSSAGATPSLQRASTDVAPKEETHDTQTGETNVSTPSNTTLAGVSTGGPDMGTAVNHDHSEGRPADSRPMMASLEPIRAPSLPKKETAKKSTINDNFVRLNMRNTAGACRGARNKKQKAKSRTQWEQRKDQFSKQMEEKSSFSSRREEGGTGFGGALTQDGVDPVDDLLDGAFTSSAKTKGKQRSRENAIPLCSGHKQPCKQLTVKKSSSGNKGREFFCCALPRGEQCNYFQWLDDTKEAVERNLMKNTSYTAFVTRQVRSYMESIQALTVPELRDLAKRHGLNTGGKKNELLVRISLWTRDELVKASKQGPSSRQSPETEHEDVIREDDFGNDELDPDSPECHASPVIVTAEILNSGDEKVLEGATDNTESDFSDTPDDSSESSEDLEFVSEPATERGRAVFMKPCIPRNDPEPTDSRSRLKSSLKQYFGHTSFRDGQEWAIRRCLDGKRTLLVAPTGSGKSLCYALPSAMMEGVCLVVSPLLSLIQDQIRVLPPSIPAVSLSGQMSNMKMTATLDDISKGRIKIVFVSPEKLASSSFRRLFVPRWNQETKRRERFFPSISLLCVDEAHCVSQWAHNFRPSYLRFRTMVDLIAPKSVLAITATAGPRVVNDVCRALGVCPSSPLPDSTVNDVGVRVMDSNRDNIDIACEVLSSQEERLQRLVQLLTKRKKAKNDQTETKFHCLSSGSVIVYVWRQRDAEAVAEILTSSDVQGGVVMYHAGMDSKARSNAQGRFLRGKARVCVATVAFGLGINKADVEGIVHLNLSSSPEHYLQEIGRAGRDGRPAVAIALILKDEVLVRHSLANGDFIVQSQVLALMNLIRSKVQAALATLPGMPNELSVGLMLSELKIACGCKAETAETLISLLEANEDSDKILRVDGFFYDKAIVSPRRLPLDDLAKTEDVVKALQKCSTCVEQAAGEGPVSSGATETTSVKANEHGLGSFLFYVSQCANCLGESAEPRHVFAALRRLQDTRAIDLTLETGAIGKALNVRLFRQGINVFAGSEPEFHELVRHLHHSFTSTLQSSASKVMSINSMLCAVATESGGGVAQCTLKSKALLRFQKLTRDYFDCDGMSLEEDSSCFAAVARPNELLLDVEPVLQHLTAIDRAAGFSGARLKIESNPDFAALNVAKFLNGIPPTMADLVQCRKHHLFGRYQNTKFSNLHQAISDLLKAN